MFRSNKKEVINSVINQNGTRHSCKSRNPGKSWIPGQARNDGLCKTYVVMYILITVISLFFLGISGCSKRPAPVVLPKPEGTVVMPRPYKVLGKWYQPIPDSKGFREKGVASWYGEDFHGRKTSSGETYNMYDMTAAHKILPLGTYVSVRNLENNREIKVRINDRGPFVKERIIDLSYTAARELGIAGPGTSEVEVIALGLPVDENGWTRSYVPRDYYTGNFTIQIGAFSVFGNAQKLKNDLDDTYKNVHISEFDDGKELYYRVRVGKCTTLEEAKRYESILVQRGFEGAFVIAE